LTGVRADVIPWGQVSGHFGTLAGLNVVGMQRRGFSKTDIRKLHRAYRSLFLGQGAFRERLNALAVERIDDPLVAQMIAFIQGGTRPLTMHRPAKQAEEP
jgi:UDP-N-acetylglucosamine acyltransferase